MRYVIKPHGREGLFFVIRDKETDSYVGRFLDENLSDEILDYIRRDGYAEVSFKLHFGEKE